MKITFSATRFLGLLLISVTSLFNPNTHPDILTDPRKHSPPTATTPICLDRGDLPEEEMHWLYMPDESSELATAENYGYLSGQLILSGAVNASDCPLNGLWPNGYANACGLERTREASLYLQNVFDDEILEAGRGLGVPPVLLKQLIRYESQFWPGQMGVYHFGLGHLTYPGAFTGVSWSRQLYSEMDDKVIPGVVVSPDLLAVELLGAMNASCQSCPLRVNITKAEESIHYIAEVLLAYCRQTSQVVYNAIERNAGDVVDYATIWRLTLLNYNVGPGCVYDGILTTYNSNDTDLNSDNRVGWSMIASNVKGSYCKRGVEYAETITAKYYDFK